MDTNKIIIIVLVAIIAILVVLLGMTILPNMSKADCRLEITSSDAAKAGDDLTIKLTDLNGNPIGDKNIKVSLTSSNNTQNYTIKTDPNGTATLTLSEENVGKNNVTCTFEGDDNYKEISTSKEITIEKGTVEAKQTSNSSTTEDPIEANRPRNDPNYKGYTPNHESEVINGWDPSEHEKSRKNLGDGTQRIQYDDGYFRIVDKNGYVITYGYGG